MIKLTITALGTPKQYQGTKGPYERNYLKAKEYNDKFLNFYVNKTTAQWKVGDVVEVEAVEEKEYTSKKDNSLQTSYDIKLPKYGGNGAGAEVMKAIEELKSSNLKQYMTLLQAIKEVYEALPSVAKPKSTYPTPESVGLNPEKMANFDHTADEDLGPIDEQFNNF